MITLHKLYEVVFPRDRYTGLCIRGGLSQKGGTAHNFITKIYQQHNQTGNLKKAISFI